MKTIIILLFLLCVGGIAFSQTYQNPVAAIQDLKEGVLVVRLRTHANKIAKLEGKIASGDLSEKAHENYVSELEETRREVAEENRLLREAFKSQYNFSDYLFLYDTLAPALKDEKISGVFLNEAGEVDLDITLKGPFLMVGIGPVLNSESAAINESLIFYDRNFNAMQSPFPSHVWGTSAIKYFFWSFTYPDEKIEELKILRAVEKMNKKLFRYHSTTQG